MRFLLNGLDYLSVGLGWRSSHVLHGFSCKSCDRGSRLMIDNALNCANQVINFTAGSTRVEVKFENMLPENDIHFQPFGLSLGRSHNGVPHISFM